MSRKPSYEELEKRVAELEAHERRLARAQTELKCSLNFTESLLASIPSPVFFKDTRGRYLGCNTAFTDMMGVTNEQIRGKTVIDLWPSDHARVYHQKDLDLLEHRQQQIYEFEIKDQQGEIRPVIYYKNVFHDENGAVAGIVGGLVDISEIRKAQLEQQTLFNMSLDMICIADINTATFRKVNPAFTTTLGYTEAELLSVPFTDFIHPDDIKPTRVAIEERLKKGDRVINFKNRYRCKNGEYRWLNWVSHPVLEKGLTYAVAHDATVEIQAYEDLRRQRDLLNSLFDKLPMGITVWSAEGDLLVVNKAFNRITGYNLAEIRNQDDWFIRVYPDPSYRRQVIEQWLAVKTSDNDFSEFTIACKDGSVKNIEFRWAFLPDGRALVTLADTTERHKAMAEREASHRLLQSVLDAVPDLLIVVDSDFRIRYSNYKGHDLIAPPPSERHRRTCYGRFKHLDAPCEECSAAPVFKNGQHVHREMINPADGRIREVRAFPIFDADGCVENVVEYVRDITEIRQVQEEISQRRQFLESVLYHAPDAIITLDDRHRVLDWNPGAEKMFGYTPEEAMGAPLDDLLARNHHHDEAGKKTAQVLSGRRVEAFETIRYHKDGTPLHVIAAGSPIMRKGKLQGVVAVYTNISDRVRSEKALKLSHQRFIKVLDSIDATIHVADIHTHEILFMNQCMIDAFGGDFTGKICWDVFCNESAPCSHCTNNRLVDADGQPTDVVVWQGKNPISKKWYMNHDRAVEWIDGRMVRIQIAIDITDFKKMEDALINAQKMEAVGTLASGIAHDFNNLLMGIQGRASLMLMALDTEHPHVEHIGAIEEHIRSAVNLTRQLLGFARGGKYEVKPIDICSLLESSASMFGRTHKEIRITVNTPKKPMVVEADKRQLEQVLLNIYVNALQAMPNGGDLYLETRPVQLDETIFRAYRIPAGQYIKISITDTGVGIPDGILQKVFDPFFTTKDKGRGTGLGLASAYGIIRNHGGLITVNSEVGKGTTFIVYLPDCKEAATEDVSRETELVRGTETILLVDDEKIIIDVGSAMLQRLGYHVLTATSGQEAIAAIKKMDADIDLVILDLIMPGMDGGTTFDIIREERPDISVILSSGYSINGQATDIMHRGCNGFIQKPFNISEISMKIRKVLDDT